MHRRDVLTAAIGLVGVTGLSGCTGDQPSGANGETDPRSTPTHDPPSEAGTTSSPQTPVETPVPFPDTCAELPDIDGLPTPPSELTEASVETFVGDFERVYAVATTDEYGGVESLQIRSVEHVGQRYVVSLSFDAVPATPTPDSDGATPTPLPVDAYSHHAVYRLTEERMLRELRSHIDDSLLSKTCWTLASA
ncbi:hypothetical protein [Halosimplex sp. TS25]|uniref:hypothetical protein n=1 Tax=Halosimplex rarum TaxID=3396619 RepID=UPI0039EBC1A0